MIVHDSVHIRPRSVDFGMDESLGVQGSPFRIDRIALEIEFKQVRRRDKLRSERSRHDEAVRISRMPETHVSKPIEHALLSQYSIRSDKIFDQRGGHRTRRCRCLRRLLDGYKSENHTRQKMSWCHARHIMMSRQEKQPCALVLLSSALSVL